MRIRMNSKLIVELILTRYIIDISVRKPEIMELL